MVAFGGSLQLGITNLNCRTLEIRRKSEEAAIINGCADKLKRRGKG
jgi:hypothetical protein